MPDGTYKGVTKTFATQAEADRYELVGDAGPVAAADTKATPQQQAASAAYQRTLARYGSGPEGREMANKARQYVASQFTDMGTTAFAQGLAASLQDTGNLDSYVDTALDKFGTEQAKVRQQQFNADFDRVFIQPLEISKALKPNDADLILTVSVLHALKPQLAGLYEQFHQRTTSQDRAPMLHQLEFEAAQGLPGGTFGLDPLGDRGRASLVDFFQDVNPKLLGVARPDLTGTVTEADLSRTVSTNLIAYSAAKRVEKANRDIYRNYFEKQHDAVLKDMLNNPDLPIDVRDALREAFAGLSDMTRGDEELFVLTGGGNPAPLVDPGIDRALLIGLSGNPQAYAAYVPGDPFKTKANLIATAALDKKAAQIRDLWRLNPNFALPEALAALQGSPSLTPEAIVNDVRTGNKAAELQNRAVIQRQVFQGTMASIFPALTPDQLGQALDEAKGDPVLAKSNLLESERRAKELGVQPPPAPNAGLTRATSIGAPVPAAPGTGAAVAPGQAATRATGGQAGPADGQDTLKWLTSVYAATRDFNPRVALDLYLSGVDPGVAVAQAREKAAPEIQKGAQKAEDELFGVPIALTAPGAGANRSLGQIITPEQRARLLALGAPALPNFLNPTDPTRVGQLAQPVTGDQLWTAFGADAPDSTAAQIRKSLTTVSDPAEGGTGKAQLDLSKGLTTSASLQQATAMIAKHVEEARRLGASGPTSTSANQSDELSRVIAAAKGGPVATGFMPMTAEQQALVAPPPKPVRKTKARLV